jgi:hypothetical protein
MPTGGGVVTSFPDPSWAVAADPRPSIAPDLQPRPAISISREAGYSAPSEEPGRGKQTADSACLAGVGP